MTAPNTLSYNQSKCRRRSSRSLTSACIFRFQKGAMLPVQIIHPQLHPKNFISNRREQPDWAARRSSSTIPVFRSTRLNTLPGASSPTSSPTTKAKKASGSSGSGWLSVKRDRRKERKGKSKQVTEQGAASLEAPFLMQKTFPLTHFGGEKAADSKAPWTRFLFGNTITFECPKQAFYMYEFPKSVRLSFRVVLERMKD